MPITLPLDHFQAVIFDLDGVVTKTARLHARAWKELFDSLLPEEQPRFDLDKDYRRYVDGKPRYDGVDSFLRSRGIDLPYGSPNDGPEQETVCGIGNRKNALFVSQLEQHGVEVYQSTIDLIHKLRDQGVKTGIISSSKNCMGILERAGLRTLFDVKIDGIDCERENIPGKPAPEIFLLAAKGLSVHPSETCIVEDALAGVEAGRRGKFAFVLGIDRNDAPGDLARAGADFVVSDLSEIEFGQSALELEVADQPAFFLDYDGTMTPIVDRPELATLSTSMRTVLVELARKYKVAVVSGRDRRDVERMVGVDGLIYAGSHGFDISGPHALHFEHEAAKQILPDLDRAEIELTDGIAGISGAWVERKKYAIAVHFRLAAQQDVRKVEGVVDGVLGRYPRLRKGYGKKIFELKPQIDWHKGKALEWLVELLEITGPCIYIGDDITDEDAFKAVAEKGIGICVQESPRPTAARYLLQSTDDVEQFLKRWI